MISEAVLSSYKGMESKYQNLLEQKAHNRDGSARKSIARLDTFFQRQDTNMIA